MAPHIQTCVVDHIEMSTVLIGSTHIYQANLTDVACCAKLISLTGLGTGPAGPAAPCPTLGVLLTNWAVPGLSAVIV